VGRASAQGNGALVDRNRRLALSMRLDIRGEPQQAVFGVALLARLRAVGLALLSHGRHRAAFGLALFSHTDVFLKVREARKRGREGNDTQNGTRVHGRAAFKRWLRAYHARAAARMWRLLPAYAVLPLLVLPCHTRAAQLISRGGS